MTSEILSPQEYVAQHKRAFREGFDFLNAHFPPECSSEYWDRTYKDLNEVLARNDGNGMLREMMMSVVAYLDTEGKKRREDVVC